MTAASPGKAPPDPLIGTTIADRFKILSVVARGSMGRVYKAEQLPLGRIVAVKTLHLSAEIEGATDDMRDYEARFMREASVLARLQHSNTVRIFDYGLWEGRSYLVMEYVDGGSLRELCKKGPLDPLEAVKIMLQVCGSLREAHEDGVVHRDLKPGNILLTKTNDDEHHVKVVDFGLVKDIEDAVEMTGHGIMLGTPLYMSPEQVRGLSIDQRTDIYALGIILYRLFTGKAPFAHKETAPLLMCHLNEPPPPFSAVHRELELPGVLEWTTRQCLAKEPNDRFQSVAELAKALKVCRAVLEEGLGEVELQLEAGRLVLPDEFSSVRSWSSTMRPTVRQAEPETQRRRWPLVLVGVTLVLALAGGSALYGLFELQRSVSRSPSLVQPVEPAPVPAPVVGTASAEAEQESLLREPDEVGGSPSTPSKEANEEERALERSSAPAPPPVARPRPVPRPFARPRPAPSPGPVPRAVEAPAPAPEPEAFEVPTNDLVDPWKE